ncbi:rho-related GTP-binding protein RhoD [Ambystoma mexicanum]|uniref:rho-related GTP-binding protein RhoD n=1 Tax=Ambystoma mexicanum TaxID=8296 RepID=UPI0037E8C8EE
MGEGANGTSGSRRDDSPTSVKAVIVGDGGCGKTSLLMVFAKGDFPEVYVPTVFEKYTANFQVASKSVEINLWDTAGQEDYDRLRPLSYTGANVILICYDVTNPGSFDNVLIKWHTEVNHFCKGVPILLVGCKTDLRKDKMRLRKLREDGLEPITYQKGQSMGREIRAVAYLECSAKFRENILDIFSEAAAAAMHGMKKKRRKRRTKRGCVLS